MKVVIVEDEGITALFLKKAVIASGHEVVSVHNEATSLLDYLKTNIVDLIFMDINIKGSIDGLQASQIIYKKYPQTSHVFITSYTDKATMQEACLVKPLGYLSKPVIIKDIEAILLLVEAHKIETNSTLNSEEILLGSYHYNIKNKTLYKEQELIKLTKQESLCFYELIKNPKSHISAEQLISTIWVNGTPNNSSLRELITRLRKKLVGLEIENIPKVGYCLKINISN